MPGSAYSGLDLLHHGTVKMPAPCADEGSNRARLKFDPLKVRQQVVFIRIREVIKLIRPAFIRIRTIWACFIIILRWIATPSLNKGVKKLRA